MFGLFTVNWFRGIYVGIIQKHKWPVRGQTWFGQQFISLTIGQALTRVCGLSPSCCGLSQGSHNSNHAFEPGMTESDVIIYHCFVVLKLRQTVTWLAFGENSIICLNVLVVFFVFAGHFSIIFHFLNHSDIFQSEWEPCFSVCRSALVWVCHAKAVQDCDGSKVMGNACSLKVQGWDGGGRGVRSMADVLDQRQLQDRDLPKNPNLFFDLRPLKALVSVGSGCSKVKLPTCLYNVWPLRT